MSTAERSTCSPFPPWLPCRSLVHGCITWNAPSFYMLMLFPYISPLQLQALQLPAFCTSHDALQHGCLWQWLCPQPKGHGSDGQGLYQWLELWFRARPPATHSTQPVPVGGGELRKLPAFPIHRAELLSPSLPATTVPLHGLLMRGSPPTPLSASAVKV